MGHGLHHHAEATHQILPRDRSKILKIWKTAGILGLITAVEFIFAFTMEMSNLRIAIYVGLTLVKAFYIVAEFMHLKYETKTLIWSIILPVIFVMWLIIALLSEGSAIFDARSIWG